MSKLLSLYGLKFHPFRPDVPPEALFTTPAVDSFVRRIECPRRPRKSRPRRIERAPSMCVTMRLRPRHATCVQHLRC